MLAAGTITVPVGRRRARTTIFALESRPLETTARFLPPPLPAPFGDFAVAAGFVIEVFLLAAGRQMMACRDWSRARSGRVRVRVLRGEATRCGKRR